MTMAVAALRRLASRHSVQRDRRRRNSRYQRESRGDFALPKILPNVSERCPTTVGVAMAAIDPLTAGGVLLATALTDAVYVMFTSAVVARKRVPGPTWGSFWYVLSSCALISSTENWVYVAFAALGSWIGAYLTTPFLHRPPGGPPVGAAVE